MNPPTPSQSNDRCASIWLHLETFLSRSESTISTLGILPKAMADLLHMPSFWYLSVQICIKPFSNPSTPTQSYSTFSSIWLHFDTFLSRSESNHYRTQVHPPKALADLLPYGFIWTPFCPDPNQAIVQPMYALPKLWQICFHVASFLSVQIRITQFSSPSAPSQSYCKFDSIWLHLNTFCPSLDLAIFEPKS